ncbi:MAG TPA: DUF6298 domain-containing protein [Gemmatimonadales bacterium]|nr:DUF6298 domain-containing protein [Gemmatimonadales bacterium]
MRPSWAAAWPVAMVFAACRPSGAPLTPTRYAAAAGPLRADPRNPRYFADSSGRAVYLTGMHTWSTLQDNGPTDPPAPFDYQGWLDTLVHYNHDFFRMYSWEQARWTDETAGDYYLAPMPWQRTGPGNALDGKPKFDLTKFNDAYFTRLRDRVAAAGKRGIYVSVMLFNGWSLEGKGGLALNDPWNGHPFNAANNVNGIDGHVDSLPQGAGLHTLLVPKALAIQDAYVKHVVDAVGDLDNVLFEISNESDAGSLAWQTHMVDLIHTYERTRKKQHPVGITAMYPNGSNGALFASPADWVSPGDSGGYFTSPPAGTGHQVIILDTDHLGTEHTEQSWVWKSFLRGLNPIFMDAYDNQAIGLGARPNFDGTNPQFVAVRRAMGYTLSYATRIPLSTMVPAGSRASTGYCLADTASHAYLVYLPDGGSVTVTLPTAPQTLTPEWFSPRYDVVQVRPAHSMGGTQTLTAPFRGDAVLYLH